MERVEFSHYNVERRKEWAIYGFLDFRSWNSSSAPDTSAEHPPELIADYQTEWFCPDIDDSLRL